ncbi:MAG: hypothetical protein KF744_12470 [Taibaiella sp.]|nr:hypothetical protein [Taibaiella sp.]
MRKIEAVLVVLFILSIILDKSGYVGFLTVFTSTTLLGSFYLYLSFFLLNDLPIRGMSWTVFRSSRKYPIVAGIGLGMSVSSIFCSAMFFPGSAMMLVYSMILLAAVALYARLRTNPTSNAVAVRTLVRCVVAITLDMFVWWITD